jgi:bis(5'-nucleosidyl)-tetraphosphatase
MIINVTAVTFKEEEFVTMDKAQERYEESVGVVLSYESSSIPISKNKINNDDALFLLLKTPCGDWNFVKGHRERNENDYETLKREIFEETGINYYDIVRYLGKINYKFMRNRSEINKEVKFYYATVCTNEVLLSREHVDYAWLAYHQAKWLLTFHESKLILEKIFKPTLSY